MDKALQKKRRKKLKKRAITAPPQVVLDKVPTDLMWTDVEVLLKRANNIIKDGLADDLLAEHSAVIAKGTVGRYPPKFECLCRTRVGIRLQVAEILVVMKKRKNT